MKQYDHRKIEKKWQKVWEKEKSWQAKDNTKQPKFYGLIEFPYPSGRGLHVGHIRSNTAMDIICRKRRAEGFNVLYPIGWDAFGLPTENYAVKTGIQPAVVTKKNTDIFRRQLKALGFSFDWSREINTTDPEYYKWTQWIFLKFFEKGLAYKKKFPINWCLSCKIGLANEEVIDGKCERCGGPTEKREKEQWMLAITKYADRLDKDLDGVDYLEEIKTQQRNWIGRSEGSEIEFKIRNIYRGQMSVNYENCIKVFTTRADTLFGATYLVLAPEHSFVREQISNRVEVKKYIDESKKKTEIERTAEENPSTSSGLGKTGVELKGIKAINPANGEEIPIFVADYVLPDYGTGAIMAVPAHDERDWQFAKKYNLSIQEVVLPYLENKKFPIRKNLPIPKTPRKHIDCILKNPKTGEYACLKCNEKFGWTTLIGGGIEDGESLEKAGLRELKEETGYKNIRFVKDVGECFGGGFAAHKNENRISEIFCLLFELIDDQKTEISEEEKGKHEVVWLKKEEVGAFLNVESSNYLWNLFLGGNKSYIGEGKLINSGKFDGLESKDAARGITEFVGGKMTTKYKLRDWVFSRQRYWGEPIPLIFCEKDNWVAVPEKDLPVRLPKVKDFKPTERGESPLAQATKWVNVKCPKCGAPAKRETDTMPNWAGSSWYYLRYVDSENKKEFADKKKLEYWTPVDWYNGGMEHVTLHLLYSRFWHKFLFDLGLVPTNEPYKKRTAHGLVLAEGGVKMSKSKGNVVNPDDLMERFGADALRVYEMFMGPFAQAINWNTDGMVGTKRFLEKVWRIASLASKVSPASKALENLIHKTIKKVTEDIEAMRFNTAISALMILTNGMDKLEKIAMEDFEILLRLLAPFAPHITEELWTGKKSIHLAPWPKYDAAKIQEATVKITIQVNGKTRGTLEISRNLSQGEIERQAADLPEIAKWLVGKNIKKIIFVPARLLNFVIA